MDSELSLDDLSKLSAIISESPHSFASGSKNIQSAALKATKCVFDLALKSETLSQAYIAELLSAISPAQAPQTRSQARANGKRRRSPSPVSSAPRVIQSTPLSSLYIQDMDDEQIWAQLELRANHICGTLEEALEGTDEVDEGEQEDGRGNKRGRRILSGDKRVDSMKEDNGEITSDEDEDESEDENDDSGENEEFGEGVTVLHDPSDEDEDEDGDEYGDGDEDEDGDEEDADLAPDRLSPQSGIKSALKPSKPRGSGHPELDDGFFDLASFNAETEAVEARSVSRGALDSRDLDDEDSNLSVDLFAPLDDTEVFDEEDLETGGEAYYKDFFDPVSRHLASGSNKLKTPSESLAKAGRVRFHEEVRIKKIKSKGKGLPVSILKKLSDQDDDDDDDYGDEMTLDYEDDASSGFEGFDGDGFGEGQSDISDDQMSESEEEEVADGDTIERMKNDLFAEEEEPPNDLSTHEKRMAALREQITTLETENIAKKDWTMMGEANARTRPQNSLLEEDLEFERAMKVVPVVTEEAVQVLEERIKSRILDGRFDDVVRTRPLDDKPFLPSRYFELKDTKSTQSLAQIYEDEFTAAQTGGVVGDDRDGKLQKEHQEIEKQWDTICSKLDALCNVHFTPKQPKASIATISNLSAASLESALPTTKSTSTMLAPEEVYAPSSNLRASSELTPAEKRVLHNKQKKKKRRMRDVLDKTIDKVAKMKGVKDVKKQKEQALKSIVKSGKGVTVVGKKIDRNHKKDSSKT